MSVLDRPDLVPVPLGYCPCEGTPHPDGDVVSLWPEISAPGGMAVRALLMSPNLDTITFQEQLGTVLLRFGVAEWTFLADDGQPIPVTPENVVLALPYGKGGRLVADKADDLYADSVKDPLLAKLAELSKAGQTKTSRPATSRAKSSRSRSL